MPLMAHPASFGAHVRSMRMSGVAGVCGQAGGSASRHSSPPRLRHMVDVHELEARLLLLLEEVDSPDYPEPPAVQEFLAGQLRLALASLHRNMAGANELERAS